MFLFIHNILLYQTLKDSFLVKYVSGILIGDLDNQKLFQMKEFCYHFESSQLFCYIIKYVKIVGIQDLV